MLGQLDEWINWLGNLRWEIGPGEKKENSLVSGDVKLTKVTISLSYSGGMNPDNNKQSEGTEQINATDKDGNVTTFSSYKADSGPFGVGFKVILSDNTEKCRTTLRNHPDGNGPGTQGCVGLQEPKKVLVDFQKKLTAYFHG